MRGAVAVVCLSVALGGCGGRPAAGPPPIRDGAESCAQCRMLISEARYAAASITSTGDVVKFDDVGCLLRYRREHPGDSQQPSWVHEYRSEAWLRFESASFVESQEITTPMGSGLLALDTPMAARELAERLHGKVRHPAELRRTP